MRPAVWDRLQGYAAMVWLTVSRLHRLREPQLQLQVNLQIHMTGIAALPVMAAMAVVTGATAVTQVTALVGRDSDVAQSWLFYGLFFELAPLLCALVLVARNSASMASELVVMHVNDEFTALRRMGIAPADFLILPRVIGLALAVPALTVFFQFFAVGSGWLAVALLQDQPLLQVVRLFLDQADPWLILASLAKSGVMGILIAAIACHHGSSTSRSLRAISDAGVHAVGNALVAVVLVDMVFAMMVYGVR